MTREVKYDEIKARWFTGTAASLASLRSVKATVSPAHFTKVPNRTIISHKPPKSHISSVKPSLEAFSDQHIPVVPSLHHSRPQSAACHNTSNKEKVVHQKKRPETAKIPRLRFQIVGVGAGVGEHSAQTEDHITRRACVTNGMQSPEFSNCDDIPNVPPSSPKCETCEDIDYSFVGDTKNSNTEVHTRDSEKHQLYLQLPVISDDDDDNDDDGGDDDEQDTARLLKIFPKKSDDEEAAEEDAVRETELNEFTTSDLFHYSGKVDFCDSSTGTNESVDHKHDSLVKNSLSDHVARMNISNDFHFNDTYKQSYNNNNNDKLDVIYLKTMTLCDSCAMNNELSELTESKSDGQFYNDNLCNSDHNVQELNAFQSSTNYDFLNPLSGKGPIIRGALDLQKNGVHFRDEKNKIFNITPRNRGRKIRPSTQQPRAPDERLMSDNDFHLAMDICRMPMNVVDNSQSLVNKSQREINKMQSKLENLVSIIKRGTAENTGQLAERYWPLGTERVISNLHAKNRSKTESPLLNISQNHMSSVDNQNDKEVAQCIDEELKEQHIQETAPVPNNNGNSCLTPIPQDTVFLHNVLPMKLLKMSDSLVYDKKPVTQQNTKVCSLPEKNYYDIICESNVNIKRPSKNSIRCKQNNDHLVQPVSPANENSILDCLHTQQLLKQTIKKISSSRQESYHPYVAWSKPTDGASSPEKVNVPRKTKLSNVKPSPASVNSSVKPASKSTPNMETRSLDDVPIATCIEQLENGKPLIEKTNKKSSTTREKANPKSATRTQTGVQTKQMNNTGIGKKKVKEAPQPTGTSFHHIAQIYAPPNKSAQLQRKSRPHSAPRAFRSTNQEEFQCLTTIKQEKDTEDDTKGIRECRNIHEHLEQKGIDLDLHTLKRALLPPDGSTTHFKLGSDLPRDCNSGLFSNPKTWLPDEHRRLKRYNDLLKKSEEQIKIRLKRSKTKFRRQRNVSATV